MNGQVEVTWLTLRTIAHSIMVRTQVSDKYIHFTLMYMNDHILPGLPTRHLVTQDKKKYTTQTENWKKYLVSKPHVLFFPCVVQKATAHFYAKVLNICHQSQKGFYCILVGIPKHQKGYLIYVHSTQTIVSSHDILFDKTSIVRGTHYATVSIVYSVRYIIS